jgi:hypothetical protein
MIPLNEAIEAGAWLETDVVGTKKYRLKLNGFSKVNLEAIDNPEELEIPIDSNIWVLEFDFINASKESISWSDIIARFCLMDDEECKYDIFMDDAYLVFGSMFAKNLGVERDYTKKYPPKVRKSGAVFFELPEDIDQLFIFVEYGDIREI